MIKLSDFVFKRLVEHGIKNVFMITGGGAMHLNDSIGKNKNIEYICNHHEQASAIAAEGYYRASGKMCAVCITTGPGGTNTLTGVIGQWLDSIPCIYISGQVKTSTLVDNYENKKLRQIGDQEINIIDIVKSVTKYSVSIRDPKDIKYHIDKAIKIATTPRYGPVWIDIPLDIQGSLINEDELREYNPDEDNIETIGEYDLDYIVNQIIDKINKSKSPLIVAGHGISLSNSLSSFLELVKKINLPVVTTFNGFDLLPSSHPNFAGRIGTVGTRSGNFAVQNADLILFLGTRNNIRQISYNWNDFAKKAFKIIVDIDENELTKPTIKPDIPIKTDVGIFIKKLNEKLESHKLNKKFDFWLNWCIDKRNKYPVVLEEYKKKKGKVNPYNFIEKLTEISNDKVFVAGNGSACVCLFQAGIVKEGQKMFWNSGCASMGYDLPAAIGAAVATKKPVVCVAGDGSIMMNLQELATMKYYKLPIKLFILNNDGYISIKQTQDNFFGNRYGADSKTGVGFPDFQKLASAFKIKYFRILYNLDIEKELKRILKNKMFICEVVLENNYKFAPKVSSEKLKDGTIISKPLEDMWPFLDRKEFEKNIFIT
jgi:acetolactate synthase-1/2/3 large subunit